MRGQLATFDLTMMQFRVLEALDREGPQYQQLLSAKFRRSKQSVGFVPERLKKLGAVRRDWCRLPAASDRVELGFERRGKKLAGATDFAGDDYAGGKEVDRRRDQEAQKKW